MSGVLIFKRCVGESPPGYGARRAYCSVKPDFSGPCCLHYELDNQQQTVGFTSYQQALTAATMAIFSEADFQNVLITAGNGLVRKRFASAKTWFESHCEVGDGSNPASGLGNQ